MVSKSSPSIELRQLALQALAESDPDRKVALALAIGAQKAVLSIATTVHANPELRLPGRPTRPTLIHPAKVPRRQVGSFDALRAVEILDIILRDEVGHVAIGNHWYRWLCERDGLDPVAHYPVLTERYKAPKLRPPFNLPARLQAGFTEAEIARLSQAC